MFFNICLLVLSLIADLLIYFLTPLCNDLVNIWVIFVSYPFIYALLFGLELLFFLIWGLCINTKKPVEEANLFYLFIVNQVIQQLVVFSRTKVRIEGKEKVPTDSNFVLLFNHLSNWDPMVIIHHLSKHNLLCVSKASNIKIPIAGPFIHKAGFIAFDRSEKSERTDALIRAIRLLRGNKYSIAIAPEGTRNKERKETLLDFHPGSFKMATKTRKPLVITVLTNTHMIHKNFPLKRTYVDVKILETIPYETYKDMDVEEIRQYTFNKMKNALEVL